MDELTVMNIIVYNIILGVVKSLLIELLHNLEYMTFGGNVKQNNCPNDRSKSFYILFH